MPELMSLLEARQILRNLAVGYNWSAVEALDVIERELASGQRAKDKLAEIDLKAIRVERAG